MRKTTFLQNCEEDPSGCWIWTRQLRRGYGRVDQGRAAHRVAYELFVGPIPDGLQIDHLCLNTACVNPDHLEAVTGLENMRRRNLLVTHCKHGHEFSPENTYRHKGRRACRRCGAARSAAYQARRAAAS